MLWEKIDLLSSAIRDLLLVSETKIEKLTLFALSFSATLFSKDRLRSLKVWEQGKKKTFLKYVLRLTSDSFLKQIFFINLMQ